MAPDAATKLTTTTCKPAKACKTSSTPKSFPPLPPSLRSPDDHCLGWAQIDLDHVVGFNDSTSHPGKSCIKPWDRRSDESDYAESDADEQLILKVPFTGSVKLRSVFLKTGPGDLTPLEVKLVRFSFDSTPSIHPMLRICSSLPTPTTSTLTLRRTLHPPKCFQFPKPVNAWNSLSGTAQPISAP